MKVVKRLVCVVLGIGILIVNAENEKGKEKLFKLLRTLDSIKRYKREKAYEELVSFLYENPDGEYIEILKRRSRKVRLEQKLLLQDLVDKFEKINAHLSKMRNSYFLQQCSKMRTSAINFLLDRGIFNIHRTMPATRRVQEDFSKLFFYVGLFKDNFDVVPRNIDVDDIDALLNDENNNLWLVGRMGGRDVRKWFALVNRYELGDIFIYAKLRGTLKKLASNLLPYLCFKNTTTPYYKTLYPRSKWGSAQNTPKDKSCETFLILFRQFLSRKSKILLKELFKKTIIKIKSGIVSYHIVQLLKFDEYLSSINKFRLFRQSIRYRYFIQNTIESKLNKIRFICKKITKKITLKNRRVEDNIITYLQDNNRYSKIIRDINTTCLYLYINYPVDFSVPSYTVWLKGRKNVEEGRQLCEKDTLRYFACMRHPLHALRAVFNCREVKLQKFVINSILNFDSYEQLCSETRYYEIGYYSEVVGPRNYLDTLKILGKVKRDMRKSMKKQYLQILNDFASRYVYYEKIRVLFKFVNGIDKSYKNELAKKILVKMLSSLYLIRYRITKLETAIVLIEEALKINSAILEDEIIRKLLLRILYQEIIIGIPFELRRHFVKIVKRATGRKIFNIIQIAHMVINTMYRNTSGERQQMSLIVIDINRVRPVEMRDKMPDAFKLSPAAIYTLFTLTADKNLLNVIKKRFPYYFKSKYEKLYKKILYGVIQHGLTSNDTPLKKMLFGFLAKNKAFLNDTIMVYKDMSERICKGEVEYIEFLPTYFRWLFDGYRFPISASHMASRVKYKTIKLYPMLLSSIETYLRLNNTWYFTTLDNMRSKKAVKDKFCRNYNCFSQYKVVFPRKTSQAIREIYKKFIKMRANEYFFHNIHFYLPLIINTKSKKIIILDFVKMNDIVAKVLRR